MTDPPSLDDFKSYAELGKLPPSNVQDDPSFLHRWNGLSVYDTYREARRLARARRWKRWVYIAELHIPDEAPIVYEGPDQYGHWNLYGADPNFLRDACVARVIYAPTTETLEAGL